jgi:PPOX class probable F420-dependent enzyme
MDVEQALEFLTHNHGGVLSTVRRDGRPQMSPVTAGVDGDGFIVISSRETAVKTKNVLRDPRVSLCAISDGFFGEWVQVDGTAEVIHLPEAMDGLVDYYRRVAGEHNDWDEYRAAMVTQQRVVLRITPERAGPNVSG